MMSPFRHLGFAAVLLAGGLAARPAAAQERAAGAGRAYCDWVEGVAASESALLVAPTLFASFGYLDQGVVTTVPEASGDDARLTAGVSVRLTGVLEGVAVRKRARAECERYLALGRVERATVRRALAARAGVLDEAMERSDRILARATRDRAERRATAQEVSATQIRVDELRRMAAATRAELAALATTPAGDGAGSLRAYFDADGEIARQEGKLRRMRAWDVSVRLGYDAYLGPIDDDESPLFAVLQVGFNLGGLFQGGAEERAARGRRVYLREERGAAAEPTLGHLRVLAREQKQRLEQTGVLLADLDKQLAELERIGGETGRRYRDVLWFEWVRVKAEHAYLTAQVAGLTELLGEEAE